MMTHSCHILGGGPSLKALLYGPDPYPWGFDADLIAINNACLRFRNVIGYFTDPAWFYKWETDLVSRRGRLIRGYLPGEEMDVPWLEQWQFTAETGLVREHRRLAHGWNSGYAAINLAVNLGYKHITLYGYDMHSVNGQTNFHTDHDRVTPEEAFKRQFIPSFDTLVEPLNAAGIQVVNATPGSALTAFPLLAA